MSKTRIVSLVCGLALSLLAIFGDQINDGTVRVPDVYKPYAVALVLFASTTLVPAVKEWGSEE